MMMNLWRSVLLVSSAALHASSSSVEHDVIGTMQHADGVVVTGSRTRTAKTVPDSWTSGIPGTACLVDSAADGTMNSARMILLEDASGQKSRWSSKFFAKQTAGRRWKLGRLTHVKATILSIALWYCLLVEYFQEAPNWGWIATAAALYLFESATCSTRRYMTNVQSPDEILEAVRQMIHSEPIVTWIVQCYHYRNTYSYGHGHGRHGRHHGRQGRMHRRNSRTKVVTHRASQQCHFRRWRDTTSIDLLHRMLATMGPSNKWYVKVSFEKMLLFLDNASRDDYIARKSMFVAVEGIKDRFTEDFTSLQVQGFKPKLLAVRTIWGIPSLGLQQFGFWLFTLLGLTVPYRIWFARHCDELKVTITKEV